MFKEEDMERKMVVLTPVRNEAWILPLFCASTSLWADHIVIADQQSTDSTREIVSRFPKVTLIVNDSPDLDESYRDAMLIKKARELVGNNGILFRIDADEIFTPDFDSEDWREIKQSKEGTVWRFRWFHLSPNFSSFFESKFPMFGAFVDDGREYTPKSIIHLRELFPNSPVAEERVALNIGLLHYQFVDWNRMQSKHRYYQCFEHIAFPTKSAIEVFRQYHWMFDSGLPKESIPFQWIESYKSLGIDLFGVAFEKEFWWDEKVNEYFAKYSPEHFRYFETYKPGKLLFAKGKNPLDKLLLAYLETTKFVYNKNKGRIFIIISKTDHILKKKFHL